MDSQGVNTEVQLLEEEVTVIKDSCTIVLSSENYFTNADIFIYGKQGVAQLEEHIVHESRYRDGTKLDSTGVALSPGPKTIVVIANSVKSFNAEALSRYDSAEQLCYQISDEKTDYPLLSCTEDFNSSDRTVVLSLKALRCNVILEHIEHSLPGYKRLEDPYLMIENGSASASVLKADGHRVTDAFSDTSGLRGKVWEKLPYDIGMYAQQPETKVFCYPCDDAASVVKPSVMIGCTIEGTPYEFRKEMPLLKRGSTLYVSLTVGTKPENYKFSFRTVTSE